MLKCLPIINYPGTRDGGGPQDYRRRARDCAKETLFLRRAREKKKNEKRKTSEHPGAQVRIA